MGCSCPQFCHHCNAPGVVYAGGHLLCGDCYLEWARTLRWQKYTDVDLKVRRVKRQATEATA